MMVEAFVRQPPPTHKAAGRVFFAACYLRTAACARFYRLYAIS